jgi:succinate-semialdehyde dehydrogenase/glutarate-semialdehyde dehydrogenase
MSVAVSVNPATGATIKEYPMVDKEAAIQLVREVDLAGASWQTVASEERAKCLLRLADLMEEKAETLGNLISDEMGKPRSQGKGEVEKCAWVCRYYAEHGAKFLADEEIATEQTKSYVRFEPLGTVLAIMPWNFPFWQVMRFAAPALMAGNAFILKHAPNVQGCAEAIEKLLLQAEFPFSLCRNLNADNDVVAEVIGQREVAAVTFTGSTRGGAAVAAIAGKYLKKSVLELGGSDPYLVLADADLQSAAEACVAARMLNSGQSCIAAKRFIVEESVADAFEKHVVETMQAQTNGNAAEGSFDFGPMARKDLRDALHDQVNRSVEQGAVLALGGQIPKGPGYFYPATVLMQVEPGMAAFDEELFGPVVPIIRAKDVDHAIYLANLSDYGLGAAVFTSDVERGETIAGLLKAGACFVNEFVKSDPRLPFGGIKKSGYGRELSHFGIREFVNVKTVVVK